MARILSGPQRVQVNMAGQFKQVGILLGEDGFLAVVKEVPDPPVPAVERPGIPAEQPLQDSGDGGGAGSQQEVEVVGDQRPGVTEGLGLFDDGCKAADEVVAVGVVRKDLPPLDAAADYVVQRTGGVYAGFARRNGSVSWLGKDRK
jgi:hypothetical protein